MRVGLSCLYMTDSPFEWVYSLDDMGFSGWEIVCEGAQRLTKDVVERIQDVLRSTSLDFTAHLPFSDLNLASVNQPIWDESVKQMGNAIHLLGEITDLVVVHPGHLSPLGAELADKAWGKNILGIQRLCDIAREYGIIVAVENMPNIHHLLGRFPEELKGMIQNVDRVNVGMTLDVGHANLTKTLDNFLELDFKHMHLHDNFGERDDHISLGKGSVNWNKVLKRLKSYEDRLVIEARTVQEGEESLNWLRRL
ncbi:MAG: sugar phosphate isomerase/epimerase [Methanocellales archaeon]|nr:sugar phosphate isomerase/epimerase [Methanocellales archaeon]MDD5447135.1 sugar phosphate isomerase/epimerase [Methanocellales archaeon]